MRRFALAAVLLLATALPAKAQYFFDYPKYRKLEVSAFIHVWRPFNISPTAYADSWRDRLLLNVLEETTITGRTSFGWGGGASVGFFIDRTIGAEILAESSAASLATTAVADLSWTWADRRVISQSASWPGTGRLSSTPISLNMIARSSGRFHEWSVSGGLSEFRNRFAADSWFAFGVTKISEDGETQLMDGLKVGLRIPATTWWKTGVNLGLAYTYKVSDSLGIKLEVRAYYCPQQELSWSFVQGNYDGYFYGEIRGEPFAKASVDFVTEAKTLSVFWIRPSSLRLGLGVSWSSRPVIEE